MKAKVKITGEIIEVENFGNETYGRIDGPVEIYTKRMLDFNISTPKKAVVEGYVARDKSGCLWLFEDKPYRGHGVWKSDEFQTMLESSNFPSITWESEPRKAKIEITLIDEKE